MINHGRQRTCEHIWQPVNGLVTNSRPFILVSAFHEKKLSSKTKMRSVCLKIFDNSFSKISYFQKSFLNILAIFLTILGSYQKLVEVWNQLLVDSLCLDVHEDFPHVIFYQLTSFQYQIFFTCHIIKQLLDSSLDT